MVPPKRGCGWQTTAAILAPVPGGVQRTASSFPVVPCKKKFLDSCVELIGRRNSLHESLVCFRQCSRCWHPSHRHLNLVASCFHLDSGHLRIPFFVAIPWRSGSRHKGNLQPVANAILAVS